MDFIADRLTTENKELFLSIMNSNDEKMKSLLKNLYDETREDAYSDGYDEGFNAAY